MPLPLHPSLEPWRARLEEVAAPCIHFSLEDAEDPALPGCRYGGHPLVPAGTAWPQSPESPMVFVGQLDFAELASVRGDALSGLPRDGILCLFYDMREQRWGFDPKDREYWRLVWTPRREDAVPLPTPKALEDAGLAFDLPVRMVPRLGASVPGPTDARASLPAAFWEATDSVEPMALRRQLTGADNAHQVGGHPWWIQDDARAEAQLVSHGLYCGDGTGWNALEARRLERGAAEWNLLWQIGSDDTTGFMWGDMGSLYLLIRDADLREQRFERAWLDLQCG